MSSIKNGTLHIHELLRYILPPTIKVDPNLPTLSDHLKQYVKYDDLPIIIYLHGQDGTR